MSISLRLATATASIAFGLALAAPAIAQQVDLQKLYHTGVNDDFGAQHDASLRAARSVQAAPLSAAQQNAQQSEYRTGQESSFDAGQTTQPLVAAGSSTAQVASTTPTAGAKRDIIGDHGAQDALAREIYQPGSRMPGW
jgi:hypothetical protein